MRILALTTSLLLAAASSAPAQLAVTQQQEQILVLPLSVGNAADSAMSVKVMDLVRDRLTGLARYKITVVSKAKLCEALGASGFSCDGLLDEQQGRQLARFLKVSAYTAGRLDGGTPLRARLRVFDIGGSGLAAAFTVVAATPATPEALAENIAQRLNALVRAGESVRDCTANRQRGNFSRAAAAAQKALTTDSAAVGAYLCTILVYEAQRQPPESLIAVADRALRIDSLNATAWDTRSRMAQQQADTLPWLDALHHLVRIEPFNTGRVLGTAQLLFQMKRHQDAVNVLNVGLGSNPGDLAINELRTRVCIEGELWACALAGLTAAAEQDTALAKQEDWLRTIIGAAQQVPDTAALIRWTGVAIRHYPSSSAFLKAHGAALDQAGMVDSALVIYRAGLRLDPSDLATSLLVAKTLVDRAQLDSIALRQCIGDTTCMRQVRNRLADKLDTAQTFVSPALASPDSGLQLNAAVIMLTAGSKLAQAQSYARAYTWLDRTLQLVIPRSPVDTSGPRRQIRTQAGFWFGLASVQTLAPAYSAMITTKNCDSAAAVNVRISRTKQALIDGTRVHPPTVQSLLNNLGRFEEQMPKVKLAFKCTNF